MNTIKKKLENIWYYYKIPIIIGVVVLFVVGETIYFKKGEEKFDNSIAIVSKVNYPNMEQVEKLKNVFSEKYGGTFTVAIYNIELGAVGEDEVTISKLSLDLGNHISSYLFIENLDSFKEATNNLEINVLGQGKEFDWLKDCGVDNLWLVTR